MSLLGAEGAWPLSVLRHLPGCPEGPSEGRGPCLPPWLAGHRAHSPPFLVMALPTRWHSKLSATVLGWWVSGEGPPEQVEGLPPPNSSPKDSLKSLCPCPRCLGGSEVLQHPWASPEQTPLDSCRSAGWSTCPEPALGTQHGPACPRAASLPLTATCSTHTRTHTLCPCRGTAHQMCSAEVLGSPTEGQ